MIKCKSDAYTLRYLLLVSGGGGRGLNEIKKIGQNNFVESDAESDKFSLLADIWLGE